ncbi:MAG TPA: hypothetical protein VG826_20695 [Pirellulales bacterium]|nr:hypothetical protein [Pirellulales bacterium]
MYGHRARRPTQDALQLSQDSRARSREAKWSLRGKTILLLTLTLAAHAVAVRGVEEEAEPSKDDGPARQRMEIMRNAIGGFRVRSSQIESPSALKFRDEPVLRYNDQSRLGDNGAQALLDATAWRLGEKGRPLALVTLEIYPFDGGTAVLTYEFVSLSPSSFEMKNTRGVTWMPASTELTMVALEDAPAPAESPRSRLVQMRQLARRFTCQEELQGEKIECRLLAQPIDRYDDEAAGILDGAIFIFANGTNPEMGLVMECSDKGWSYGVFRLSSATLFAQLDGKSFDVPPKGPGYPANATYTATRHSIPLPAAP